jgi:hypothetical protein
MTEETKPDWVEDDEGGEYCDVEVENEDPLDDDDLDDAVIVAGVDPGDEAAKEARRREYAALFPGDAVRNWKEGSS